MCTCKAAIRARRKARKSKAKKVLRAHARVKSVPKPKR